jgi:tetratricopeptide (TPR) repeat protein
MARVRPLLVLFLSLAASACASPDVAGKWKPPSPEVDARVRRAELLLYEERPLEALAEARAAESLDPGSPDALRMLQAVRSAAGEDWQVRREAEAAVADRPDDPLALFLLARTESDPRRTERLLRAALRGDPAFLWARLAMAQLLLGRGDLRGAEREIALAEETAPDHGWTSLVASQAAAARHRPGQGVALLREAVRRDPGSFRARETLARKLLDLPGGGPEAREMLRACFLLAPRARAAASGWREALEAGASPEELRLAVEAVDAAEKEGPLTAQARHLRGAARAALGDPEGALPDLRAALAAGEDRTAALDDLRAALFVLGRYVDALDAERACTPPGLLDDPTSETFAARRRLGEAASALAAAPDDRPALARLAVSCREVGWLREAAVVEARRVALDPEDAAALAGAEEAARTLRFLDEFRSLWKGAYFVYQAGGDGGDLDLALKALREISLRRLGVDLTDGLERRSFFFLGDMAESVRAVGPAGEWFRGHGLALLLGRPSGQPVEARLLRVVSLHRDRGERILGRPCPATVVVGEGLLVPSRRESGGAVLGGATVGDLVFLDLQGVARWAGSATRARRDPSIRAAVEAIPGVGPVEGDEAVSLRFPGRVTERIALSVEAWSDPRAALADFLDAARCHELAHAADAERYLPVFGHPLAGLVLLLRGRLSGNGVTALLEGDAEIVAVASCREPRAALATLASFLPARDSSPPHSRGYFEVLEELVGVLRERGAVPEDALAVRVLDGLDPAVIRSAAREVCRRRGLRAE